MMACAGLTRCCSNVKVLKVEELVTRNISKLLSLFCPFVCTPHPLLGVQHFYFLKTHFYTKVVLIKASILGSYFLVIFDI